MTLPRPDPHPLPAPPRPQLALLPPARETETRAVRAAYGVLNALQALFVVFWTALWTSLAAVAMVLTLRRDLPLAMARTIWAPGLLKGAGTRFEVAPLPDVDWSRPHIFVMNHQSMLDIPVAFAGLPANLRFVAKHSLKYVPFLGWYMWLTGMIFVNRSNRTAAIRSLAQAGARIRQGASILVYPEGRRTRDGRLLPFKKGPFVLALEAKVPIVPVAVDGSYNVLPPDGFRIRPATVRLKVGEPIDVAAYGDRRDDLIRDTRNAIIQLNRDLGGGGGDPADAIADAGVEGRAANG